MTIANDRQLFICAHALFNDGWPSEAIMKALGITSSKLTDVLTMGVGDDADLHWERKPVKDKCGRIIIRDQSGQIVKRMEP